MDELQDYNPETVNKLGLIHFYTYHTKLINPDIDALHDLEYWLEMHKQLPTKQTYRKLNTGIAFLIDQYPLEEHSKQELNEARYDISRLVNYSIVDRVVGELLVVLYAIKGQKN